MQIRIEGRDLPGRECGRGPDFPGYTNIHVGVQRRSRPSEHLELQPGDADSVAWSFEAALKPGPDLLGPYIQGGPGERFIYLSWGTLDDAGRFDMFRRAKLFLADVEPVVLAAAERSGVLVGRLRLTDAKGHPICARVKPPQITWSARKSPTS
jgi:hypothetical protein